MYVKVEKADEDLLGLRGWGAAAKGGGLEGARRGGVPAPPPLKKASRALTRSPPSLSLTKFDGRATTTRTRADSRTRNPE